MLGRGPVIAFDSNLGAIRSVGNVENPSFSVTRTASRPTTCCDSCCRATLYRWPSVDASVEGRVHMMCRYGSPNRSASARTAAQLLAPAATGRDRMTDFLPNQPLSSIATHRWNAREQDALPTFGDVASAKQVVVAATLSLSVSKFGAFAHGMSVIAAVKFHTALELWWQYSQGYGSISVPAVGRA